jgi:hypothetical protein
MNDVSTLSPLEEARLLLERAEAQYPLLHGGAELIASLKRIVAALRPIEEQASPTLSRESPPNKPRKGEMERARELLAAQLNLPVFHVLRADLNDLGEVPTDAALRAIAAALSPPTHDERLRKALERGTSYIAYRHGMTDYGGDTEAANEAAEVIAQCREALASAPVSDKSTTADILEEPAVRRLENDLRAFGPRAVNSVNDRGDGE